MEIAKNRTIQTRNPFTGVALQTYRLLSDDQLIDCLIKSDAAFGEWQRRSIQDRIAVLQAAASILENDIRRLSVAITAEMGKPISESEAEIRKCAWVCRYYAAHAENFLSPVEIATDAQKSFVRFDPIGTVLAVMPWNFPFWQVFRFLAPALAAGNTALLKHASNVVGCGEWISDIMHRAGCPQHVFQHLIIDHEQVAFVLENPIVKAVTLTGSEKAGSEVAELAGKYLKKTVLELGGSNAFIVLDDARLDTAVNLGVSARMLNTGQSCIAAKRFIVVDSLYEAFVERFVDAVGQLKAGDPFDADTQIGLLARKDLAEKLHDQVLDAVNNGARLLCGGWYNECFYAPTVLADVQPGMKVFDEETFGPVAAIIRAADTDDAIRLSELSDYGLGVTICTENISTAMQLAASVTDGAVFINELVKSDPRLPFGGTKKSGYGRELSRDGLMEFVNRKVVYVA